MTYLNKRGERQGKKKTLIVRLKLSISKMVYIFEVNNANNLSSKEVPLIHANELQTQKPKARHESSREIYKC